MNTDALPSIAQPPWVDNGDGTESRTRRLLTAKRTRGVAATCTVTVTEVRDARDHRLLRTRNEFVEKHDDDTHILTSEETIAPDGSRHTRFESVVETLDGRRQSTEWTAPAALLHLR